MNTSFIMLLALVIFLGAGFGGSFVGGVIYGQTLQDDESELSPRLGAAGQFQGGGPDAAGGGQRGQGRQGQGGGFAGAPGEGGPDAARENAGAGNAIGGQGQGGEFSEGQGRGSAAATRQGGGQDGPSEEQVSDSQSGGGQDGQQRVGPGQGAQSESTAPDSQANPSPNSEEPVSQVSANSQAGPRDGSDPVPAGRGGAAGTVQGLEGDVLTVASPRGELTVMLSDSTTVYEVSETTREALTADARVRVIGSRSPEGEIAAQSVVIVPDGVEALFGAAGAPGGRQRGGGP